MVFTGFLLSFFSKFTWFYLVVPGFIVHYLILLGFTGFYRIFCVLVGCNWFCWFSTFTFHYTRLVLLGFTWFNWVLLGFTGFLLLLYLLLDLTCFYWALFDWVLLVFTGFLLLLFSKFTWFYWVLLGCHIYFEYTWFNGFFLVLLGFPDFFTGFYSVSAVTFH